MGTRRGGAQRACSQSLAALRVRAEANAALGRAGLVTPRSAEGCSARSARYTAPHMRLAWRARADRPTPPSQSQEARRRHCRHTPTHAPLVVVRQACALAAPLDAQAEPGLVAVVAEVGGEVLDHAVDLQHKIHQGQAGAGTGRRKPGTMSGAGEAGKGWGWVGSSWGQPARGTPRVDRAAQVAGGGEHRTAGRGAAPLAPAAPALTWARDSLVPYVGPPPSSRPDSPTHPSPPAQASAPAPATGIGTGRPKPRTAYQPAATHSPGPC